MDELGAAATSTRRVAFLTTKVFGHLHINAVCDSVRAMSLRAQKVEQPDHCRALIVGSTKRLPARELTRSAAVGCSRHDDLLCRSGRTGVCVCRCSFGCAALPRPARSGRVLSTKADHDTDRGGFGMVRGQTSRCGSDSCATGDGAGRTHRRAALRTPRRYGLVLVAPVRYS
jgi:hypothetical protein